jgi:hypothetical protein
MDASRVANAGSTGRLAPAAGSIGIAGVGEEGRKIEQYHMVEVKTLRRLAG